MAKGVGASIKKAIKKAGSNYQKWASSEKVRKATRQAEKIIVGAGDAVGKASGVGEIGSGTRTAVGVVKAIGGHNARTRRAGGRDAIVSGASLAASLAKRAATQGAAGSAPAVPSK